MKETIKPMVVPFEIAKLLKEVGYDEKIAEFWAYADPWTAKSGVRKGGKYKITMEVMLRIPIVKWESTNVSFAKAFKLSDKHPAISVPSYNMVQMEGVSHNELHSVKKQYPWFAPFIDNWKELSLLFEEEMDGRLFNRIRHFCNEADAMRFKYCISL